MCFFLRDRRPITERGSRRRVAVASSFQKTRRPKRCFVQSVFLPRFANMLLLSSAEVRDEDVKAVFEARARSGGAPPGT